MTLPKEIVDTLNAQTARIAELVEHVSALEYMLAQTMSVAISHESDPAATLQNMQEYFSEKGTNGQAGLDESNPGFASAIRVFTSVRTSIT